VSLCRRGELFPCRDISVSYIPTVKTIAYTLAARRALRRLPTSARRQIEAKLAYYAEKGGGDVKALVGTPGARLRAGDWRVIFVETETTIEVRAVGHRREIYR
jgi:mRNA interferase RelE/StbE